MKYLKVATTLLLLLSLVAMQSFAAGKSVVVKKGHVARVASLKIDSDKDVLSAKRTTSKLQRIEAADLQLNLQRTIVKGQELRAPLSSTPNPGQIAATYLNGTYRVGTGGNFRDLTEMALALNYGTITGPVTMLLTQSSYTEPAVSIGLTTGASDTTAITIRPDSNVASVVITLTPSSTFGGGLVFNGAKNITLEGTPKNGTPGTQGVTVQLASDPSSSSQSTIRIRDGASKITVNNCIVPGRIAPSGLSGWNAISITMGFTGALNQYITVHHCVINGGAWGVFSSGISPQTKVYPNDILALDYTFTITNNTISNMLNGGVALKAIRTAYVTDNTITNISLPAGAAAVADRVAGIYGVGYGIRVINNKIDGVANLRTASATAGRAYGVRLAGYDNLSLPGHVFPFGGLATNARIFNNTIAEVRSMADGFTAGFYYRAYGVSLENGRNDSLYNNSISFAGAELDAIGANVGLQLIDVYDGSVGYSYRTGSKNNIFSMDRTGTDGGDVCILSWDQGGLVDYRGSESNVYYAPNGFLMSTIGGVTINSLPDLQFYGDGTIATPHDTKSQVANPWFTTATNLHLDASKPSAADGIGTLQGNVAVDLDGITRTAPCDAGAYEGSATGTPHDVLLVDLVNPGASGVPAGLPFSPFQVLIGNNTQSAEAGVSVHVQVFNTLGVNVYDQSTTASIGAGELATVELATPWTPVDLGDDSIAITVTPAADDNNANNAGHFFRNVAGVSSVPYASSFEAAGDRIGWFADGDFALGDNATNGKYGGARTGTKCFVTVPYPTNVSTTVGDAPGGATSGIESHLYSPYFDMRTTDPSAASLTFYQAIQCEPYWDRSVMEYTLDTGKTWLQLGGVNDTNGINWYSTNVYENAYPGNATCFDEATAAGRGWPQWDPTGAAPAAWSSNGACDGNDLPTGPDGYIIVSYNLGKLAPAVSPIGHNYIRFRYTFYTDNVTTYGNGVAIDDFVLGSTPTATPAALAGTLYLDSDGSGLQNGGEAGRSGVIVTLTYFGAPTLVKDTTDTNGAYSLTMTLPGVYGLSLPTEPFAFSEPATSVTYAGNGTPATMNVGYFSGSISGVVYHDVNDNGTNNTEAGLSGWTVEVHKDSLHGPLYTSVTSGVGGAYTAYVPLGTWVVSEVGQTGYRKTEPATYYTETTTGASGSGTAVLTGKNFGNFQLGSITVLFATDVNGDGLFNETLVKLPGGVQGNFKVVNPLGVVIKNDSLGNLVTTDFTVANLDTGTYKVYSYRAFSPLYLYTNPVDTFYFAITTGGTVDTAKYLLYKYATVNGHVYTDVNGNAKKEAGDNAILGYTVNLTGAGAASTTTDASGNYSFTGVRPGAHNVTLTLPLGSFTVTKGSAGYTTTGFSSGQAVADSFGVFANVSISGTVYRDRNNNGTKDGIDNGIVATVWLKKVLNTVTTYTSTTSAADGSFSFADLGPGAYSDTVEFPAGYGQTQPLSGGYSYTAVSGGTHTGDVFGFFQLTDNTKYQTLNMATILAAWNAKPGDHTKTGVKGIPTVSNILSALVTTPITVGIVPGPALQPKKYSDVWKTLKNKGGATQSALPAGGFDFDVKHKLLSAKKPYASMDPGKINNALIGNLLLLNINVLMSENGNTASNFGSLIINDGGMFQGSSIAAFIGAANNYMTNWQKVPQSTYDAINTLAENINNAFAVNFHYDASQWGSTGNVVFNKIDSGATVYTTSFLKPATGVAPRVTPQPIVPDAAVPTVYALYQNYPNPFNPTTNIRFDLPMQSIVTVKIYNMLGQEIATLNDHELMDAGQTEVTFDANAIASGVYFYRVVAEGSNDNGLANGNTFTKIMKMVLVK